ncbi:MAG: metalloregulator ArsR/SmtB family transcription factor [Rhodospirillaceae bacterium]|nr:metalloregulator ArsR/SmtB family transcription factor [Rhodospirillaceae bacterium]
MSHQPGLARMASLIADPAREAMLVALAGGRALPAGELAAAAGVSAQSASRHLHKLVEGGLLQVWSQGRFRYYRIADERVAAAIEALCDLATRPPRQRKRPPAQLCFARCCYDHLAGELGVALADGLAARGLVRMAGQEARFTGKGRAWLAAQGIPREDIALCMDWTERRPHLAGPGGRAILAHLLDRKLLRGADKAEPRALALTPKGRAWFAKTLNRK